MVTRIIRHASEIAGLARLIGMKKLPVTVTITAGASRTSQQNRLAFQWFKDIASQLGDRSVEEVRAECKLIIGVPILREENEAFRVSYDRTFSGLGYEEKLEAVRIFDLPITRLMTTKQMGRFCDDMQRHWGGAVRLTDPQDMKYAEGMR